ncbi:putative ribonuclease H-like domain-containing protein [Tanacetum coccineum]|uniref:Ribonuclease H-like domain-containing protein n=1 Tax=Tanacetum coccineum TaxID=301880 RepID=A0ABQ5CJM2_9ASTR
MVLGAILMKTGLKAVNTARPVTTAHLKTTVYSARAMSYFSNKHNHLTSFFPPSGLASSWNIVLSLRLQEFVGGFVTFWGEEAKGGKITGKGTLKTAVEIRFLDLKSLKEQYVRNVDMKNIASLKRVVTCLVCKAHLKKSCYGIRRLGHKTKDETSGILKSFITEIENLVDKKVKIIKCDNETEFKNRVMSEFCEEKGIKREFSVARTPQQNGVAERRNRTLIKAAKTMLADSKLPTIFWAEVVNTACYVQNRVLVVKPHNKTPYELFRGRTPALSFMRPFGCHVTILNTLDYLGKFDGKSDEELFVGYLMNSKAFRVYNIRTRKVEENLHIRFLEDKPIIAGDGPKWLFDIDVLTKSTNYVPVVAGTNSNDLADGSLFDSSSKNASNDEPQPFSDAGKKDDEGVNKESGIDDQERPANNMNNITTTYLVPFTPNTRIHKDHSLDHVIGDVQSGVQTRRMTKTTNEQGFISDVYEGKTHEDLHTCLFACFISQEEPKKVWTLVDLLSGKRAIGTKWVYRNKKDERGIVIRNQARLIAQCYTQEEGIDCDEVFAPVARIEAIRLFLAYASFKDFVVYQMDVKSAFLYDKIEEEVYVCQPPGFKDPEFLDIVYKVEKTLYGLHQAPRACVKSDILLVQVYVNDIIFGSTKKELCTEFEKLMHKKFQMISMGELTFFLGLQMIQKDEDFHQSRQDENAEDVDVHLYRSMIGSLMYLTSSRSDIMFVVCACARFQVTPKVSHLHVVKRIFRYLKGQPKLGLWYPKDSPFDLEAYTDSDYAGASLDRKSTTGVKNPVFHSKTKYIEIKHHFIRDSNEKKLIQMIKILTNQNVADLLTKAFDIGRFQYLIASIGRLNL